MKSKLLTFASAVMAFQFSFANPGPEDLPWDNVRLNLDGGTKVIRNWEWPGWSGFYLSVSNGTLAVTGRMTPKHGTIDIFAGGTPEAVTSATKDDSKKQIQLCMKQLNIDDKMLPIKTVQNAALFQKILQ